MKCPHCGNKIFTDELSPAQQLELHLVNIVRRHNSDVESCRSHGNKDQELRNIKLREKWEARLEALRELMNTKELGKISSDH